MTDTATAADMTPADKLRAACADLGLTMRATFVPFSQSRNAKADTLRDAPWQSLNWLVTLECNGRDVLTTDYGQGIGHAPSSKGSVARFGSPNSLLRAAALRIEMEQGRCAVPSSFGVDGFSAGKPIPAPDISDVMFSLVLDAGVLDAGGFEDWAAELGYSPDSRSAEAIYRACLDIALKLRAAIGDAGIQALRTAGEDF